MPHFSIPSFSSLSSLLSPLSLSSPLSSLSSLLSLLSPLSPLSPLSSLLSPCLFLSFLARAYILSQMSSTGVEGEGSTFSLSFKGSVVPSVPAEILPKTVRDFNPSTQVVIVDKGDVFREVGSLSLLAPLPRSIRCSSSLWFFCLFLFALVRLLVPLCFGSFACSSPLCSSSLCSSSVWFPFYSVSYFTLFPFYSVSFRSVSYSL
jgi:hypothetical protein